MKNVNLVLGTMTFGESVFPPEVEKFINTFLDTGYRDIDTAYVYNNGDCERMIGQVLLNLDRPYAVATKVNPRVSGKLDDNAVRSQLSESLKRLNVSSVDIVYLHFPDPATPVVLALEEMQRFYEKGKYKELGLSNFPAWMVSDIWHICDNHGWVKPTVYEGKYNPLTRGAEVELDACLSNYGIRFYAHNPLAGGILTGKYKRFEEDPMDGRFINRPNYKKRYWKKCYFEALQMIEKESEMFGIGVLEATYRWLAYHSMLKGERDDAILIAASKLEHLKQDLEIVQRGPLPKRLLGIFDAAWDICRTDSPEYFTLYTGKGTVGGENK